MNILELCLSPSFGGLEIHMRDFSRWLERRGDVSLHFAVRLGSRIDQSLQDLARPTLRFPDQGRTFPIWKARWLASFIAEHSVDVIHVHWKDDLPLAALAKRLSARPVRLIHTRQMSLPGRKFDPYHRFVYSSLDGFIAITRSIAAQAEKNLPIPKDRIHQIYYGVDVPPADPDGVARLRRELGLEGKFVVGVVGRVTEPKGQHLLIQAIDLLRGKGVQVHGLIVGEPFEETYMDRLKTAVREHALSDQVAFMPFHPKPYEIMRCFDVLALTTRAETFGLVLVEAMHCGVAVIGSDAEGVPEIIDDGQTGLLFKTSDAGSLAAAIRKLWEAPDLRRRLAEAGRTKARKDFDAAIQYEKFYRILCGKL
jgi:L-malate glycosyltransferase